VATAVPVGSELVSRKLRLRLSSATIRNVMTALEQAGLLEQPHVSAGRMPTARGYRLYVDSVMEVPAPSAEQVRRLEASLGPQELEVDQILERAAEVLADAGEQAAFVIGPTVKQRRVRQIELVLLSERRVLCVLVAGGNMCASHAVEIGEPMTRDEAVSLARFINAELAGQPVSGLLEALSRRLLAQQDSIYHLVRRALEVLEHALSNEPEGRVYLEGVSYLVSQPEFARDPRRTHAVLQHLESPDELLAGFRRQPPSPGVRVHIGREVPVEGLEACSAITASFGAGEAAGTVGLIGPTRMAYPQLTALADAMARCLTGILSRWETR
jgi:heat-inducible transcriptional repressor